MIKDPISVSQCLSYLVVSWTSRSVTFPHGTSMFLPIVLLTLECQIFRMKIQTSLMNYLHCFSDWNTSKERCNIMKDHCFIHLHNNLYDAYTTYIYNITTFLLEGGTLCRLVRKYKLTIIFKLWGNTIFLRHIFLVLKPNHLVFFCVNSDTKRMEELFTRNQQMKEQHRLLTENIKVLENRYQCYIAFFFSCINH